MDRHTEERILELLEKDAKLKAYSASAASNTVKHIYKKGREINGQAY